VAAPDRRQRVPRPAPRAPSDLAAARVRIARLADRRDDHGSTESALDVRAALAQLPEGQRLALVLVDMHGLGVAEAAEVLGVAEGTVKSRCARGRARARRAARDGPANRTPAGNRSAAPDV
jgi:RNA polymerase sigma-70 factor (ECF subfamily)